MRGGLLQDLVLASVAIGGTVLAAGAIYVGVKNLKEQSIRPYGFVEEFFPNRNDIARMSVRN